MNYELVYEHLEKKYNTEIQMIEIEEGCTILIMEGIYYLETSIIDKHIKEINKDFKIYNFLRENYLDEIETLDGSNTFLNKYVGFSNMKYSEIGDCLYMSLESLHYSLKNYEKRDDKLNEHLSLLNDHVPKKQQYNFNKSNYVKEKSATEELYRIEELNISLSIENEKEEDILAIFTAKSLGHRFNVSTRKINTILELLGYQSKVHKTWIPAEKLCGKEYFKIKYGTYGAFILWTEKAVIELEKKIKDLGLNI